MTSPLQQLCASPLYRKLAGEDSPVAVSWGMLAFRWWGVLMLALTYYKTQLAWGPRPEDSATPLLPLWDGSPALPQFDLYWPLLLTLALVPFVARLGLILHSLTLFYAIITDLTRIQPECFSPVILLWATLPSDNAKTIARAHLAAMWFFAGFHKLMAPAFLIHVGPEIFTYLLKLKLSNETAHVLGIMVAIIEMSVGLGVLFPWTRRFAAIVAVGMHFVIFFGATNIPEGMDQLAAGHTEAALAALHPKSWYQPVWPWNLLLMWAGIAFFWNDPNAGSQSKPRLGGIVGASALLMLFYFVAEAIWPWNLILVYLIFQTSWTIAETTRLKILWQRAVMSLLITAIMISPFGYYLGIVNPYLANCIYSGNFIIGVRLAPNFKEIRVPERGEITSLEHARRSQLLGFETSRDLGISLPPSERMFQRFFAKTGKLHERMILYYPGWMSMFTGIKERELWLGHGEKINGLSEGPWVYYDNAGRKSAETTYVRGVENGPAINWRPDGTKESEGQMRNNQLHGEWKFYEPDGTKTEVFRDGVRVQ